MEDIASQDFKNIESYRKTSLAKIVKIWRAIHTKKQQKKFCSDVR